ncbi:asparagine synthase [Biomaibacter acetigenes]|uniref:Asparagine synthase n=1 Tax=Biomaibacter acetigenes TaxID=2316383 RepID=A0A3G2R8M3_9FIRM|nr:asparagine synthase-related protein [Biomaibacter acetigenes]AYO31388.1 asparagine synthase [Biomaibacter acetigenes]
MSRIVAVISEQIANPKRLAQKLLDKIKHHGSSKSRIYTSRGAVLGQNYFSSEKSVDFQDDKPAVVANANIFNEDSKGDSPQRIIQKLYQEKGHDVVNHLDGSFAFVVAQDKKVFAARDPIGLKPLYYIKTDDALILASEIKALVGLGEDIKTFPPGYYYSSDMGFVKYARPSHFNYSGSISEQEAAGNVRQRLINSVAMNCRNRKNPGIYLSGGIDSSVIAAAAKEVTEDISTFSVGVSKSTDLPKARVVARHLGSNHHEYVYTLDEMLKVLPQVIYHLESFDMYLVRSSIANYMLSRMAHEAGSDFVLCGEGGDELFGGYHYLKNMEPARVEAELEKLTCNGHANGFQRVDRMTSAFSIDGRMPFMNSNVTQFASRLPVKWKIYNDGSRQIEKWILRKAFERDLPEEIVWREKQKFFQGAGSAEMLSQYAEENISDEEFLRERRIREDFELGSKEELLYYRIFKDFFPQDSILDTIGRTATIG